MSNFSQQLHYIGNTGGNPKVEWFVEDHEPIGENLISAMTAEGLIEIIDGRIKITTNKEQS